MYMYIRQREKTIDLLKTRRRMKEGKQRKAKEMMNMKLNESTMYLKMKFIKVYK